MKTVNIVYASDDNFAEMLGISMISVFENNRVCDEIDVYVLDNGISPENRDRLISVSEKYSRKVYFIDSAALLNSDMKQERGSLSTFSRLYAAQLLPETVDKALYLDCDILVPGNLSEMYATDIKEYYGAAVRDCISDAHKKNIGLNPDEPYFNAGVYLINVEKWRNDNISAEFEKFADKYNNNVPYADQGILNGVTASGTRILPLEYNCYTVLYDFDYKSLMKFRRPSEYYSEEEISEAVKKPAIVHFSTCFLSLRPWIQGCTHPYADEWIKYKKISPWEEMPLREDNRSAKKKFAVRVYRFLPGKLAVFVVGLLHSVIMPAVKR